MNNPILMLIVVGVVCGGAWATQEPGSMANVSLVETPAATTNLTVILMEPILNDDDDLYTLMSFSWNQKVREVLATVNWAFKYVAAKVNMCIEYFEKNREILRDLQRRRQEVLDMVFRVKQRRNKKVKEAPPLKLFPLIKMYPLLKPLSVRLMIKPTFLSYLAASINATTGQPYIVPKKIIVAMI